MSTSSMIVRLLFSSAVLLAPGWAAAEQPSKNLGNVMLLGDSITQAAAGNQGYRYGLWKRLVDAGYQFDFVGSLRHNFDASNTSSTSAVTTYPDNAGMAFDADNEGHWGWKTSDVLGLTQPTRTPGTGIGKLSDWLAAYTPDTAIVLLGVNDIRIATGASVAATKANMQAIVDAIVADNPKVRIYLCSVLPTKPDFADLPKIAELNEAYRDLVNRNPALRYIDVGSRFDPALHAYDGVHPNPQGEQILAEAIFAALGR
ncbi:GDSL-type esterase/lipase family protein [Bosea vestrisii]|uniref:SGNH/GDSL hydrolase family protein n=1 Tax=Bosea vestrisii TaxID=151416 RepID=UPI0024DFA5CD|nr:GDSL-type esterase/lipase family protein [Bosea vestrisii]WID96450.1 GDSL-type esterase/lipase family protein [Bosea vestrisii]